MRWSLHEESALSFGGGRAPNTASRRGLAGRRIGQSMPTRSTLYFHAPCFDGLVSAALAWDFLEARRDWTRVAPRGVDYRVSTKWLRAPRKAPFAVVDFLYHPAAAFWADHHATTFLSEELERDFRRRRRPDLVYDRRAPACADLLWRHLWTAFRYRNEHFRDMVTWAARIDAAAYRTVNEAIAGTAPALTIRLALSQVADPRDCEAFLPWFRTETLSEIAERPTIRTSAARARRLLTSGLQRFRQAARLEDDIVVFDVDTEGAMVSRYAPYRFFPDARYSAGIMRNRGEVKVTAMRNPWRSFGSAPLGSIFRSLGGGGHERVGSVVLKAGDARRAPEVLKEIVSAIRLHERVKARTA